MNRKTSYPLFWLVKERFPLGLHRMWWWTTGFTIQHNSPDVIVSVHIEGSVEAFLLPRGLFGRLIIGIILLLHFFPYGLIKWSFQMVVSRDISIINSYYLDLDNHISFRLWSRFDWIWSNQSRWPNENGMIYILINKPYGVVF